MPPPSLPPSDREKKSAKDDNFTVCAQQKSLLLHCLNLLNDPTNISIILSNVYIQFNVCRNNICHNIALFFSHSFSTMTTKPQPSLPPPHWQTTLEFVSSYTNTSPPPIHPSLHEFVTSSLHPSLHHNKPHTNK